MVPEDYFRHFGLERKYGIDTSELRKRYYAASRERHPDMHGASTDEDLGQAVALNNEAYKVLSDPHQRLLHILQAEGCGDKVTASPDAAFLMEMMELGEEIEALREHPEWKLSLQTHKLLGFR